MRNLKKFLSVLLVVAVMATAMVPAFAADTFTYETQAKALNDLGLFKGTSTTEFVPDLGSALNREQGIAIVVRLLGKEKDALAMPAADIDAALASYSDAKDIELKAYVAYAIKNGLVKGDGKAIDPKGSMEGRMFATILLRNLGYADTEFVYDTAAADLSKKGGLTEAEATKFNAKALIRDDLVGMAYGSLKASYKDGKNTVISKLVTDKAVDEAKAIELKVYTKPVPAGAVTVTVVGKAKFNVAFDAAVDSTKAAISVKKGTIPYNTKTITWAEDKKSAVVEMASALSKGDYEITVAGLTETALVAKVTAEDEKVTKVAFNSDKATISRTSSNDITAGYKIFNQYNEDISNTVVTATSGRGTSTASAGTLTITDATTVFKIDEKIAVSLLHVDSGTFVSAVLTVADKAQVAEVAIKSLVLKDSKDLDTSKTASDYKLEVEFKDQYGNVMKVPADVHKDIILTVSDPSKVTVNTGTATSGTVTTTDTTFNYDSSAKKMYLNLAAAPSLAAGTSKITIISKTTGKLASFDVVVKETAKVDVLTISAPELAVAGETVKIPFTAIDQFGNAITSASVLTGGMTNLTTSAGTIKFVQDYVNNKADLVLDLRTVTAAKTVIINGITKTNKLVQLSISAQAPRKPMTISGIKDFTANFAKDAKGSFTTAKVIVKDQYGRDITTLPSYSEDTSDATMYGTAATSYRINVVSGSASYVKVTDDAYLDNTKVSTLTFNAIAKGSSSITLKLEKGDGSSVINGSEYVFTSQVVEKADIASYELADIAKVYVTANSAYAKAITVNGILADGTKVVVPSSYYTVTVDAAKVNATSVAGKVYAPGVTFGQNETEKTIPVIVTVNGANGASVLTKNFIATNVLPVPTTLTLVTAGVAKVEGTDVVSTAVGTLNKIDSVTGVDTGIATLAANAIKNVDQYGVEDTNDTYTLVVTNLAKDKTIAGYNDGKATNVVAGDTFNVTAITSNGVSKTFKVILK